VQGYTHISTDSISCIYQKTGEEKMRIETQNIRPIERFPNFSSRPLHLAHDEGPESKIAFTDIRQLVSSAINPATFLKHQEEISFHEYIEKVLENPNLIRTATQRIYNMITAQGREPALIDGETVYRYKFFTNPPNARDAISGIEKPIHKLVQTLEGAANGSGPDRRIILLVGPVGSAKTTLARILKNGLEAYSRTDGGALYGTTWDLSDESGNPIFTDLPKRVECGVHDDPFKLIPNDKGNNIRDKILETINQKLRKEAKENKKILPYEYHSEGGVCPSCNDLFDRLLKRYEGDTDKVFKHIRAKRIVLDEDKRVGITSYEAKDEKSQDSEQLTGTVNLRKLMQGGTDSSPHAFNFDGELCLANRGIAHFDEMLKLLKEMTYTLLTAAQDRKYKATKFALISFDGFIIGTTNIPDWERVKNDRLQEAIRNRIIEIQVPYNSRVDDEVRIYSKTSLNAAQNRNIHISPHAAWIASLWSVMTRLAEPKSDITLLQKALLYNGEQLKDYTPFKVQQMKKDVPIEANELLKGIAPRTVENAVSDSMSHSDVTDPEKGSRCVSPFLVVDSLDAQLSTGIANVTPQERTAYKGMLKEVEKELDNRLKKDVHRAIAGDDQDVENLFTSYIRNVLAWKKKEKLEDLNTKRLVPPDEALMKSIENKLDVTDASKTEYRNWVIEQIGIGAAEGKPFKFKTDQRLRKSLEDVLVERHSDITISLPNLNKDTASKEEQKQLQIIKTRLIEKFGYCEHCSEIALSRSTTPENRGSVGRH
jgi:serine protein kinase